MHLKYFRELYFYNNEIIKCKDSNIKKIKIFKKTIEFFMAFFCSFMMFCYCLNSLFSYNSHSTIGNVIVAFYFVASISLMFYVVKRIKHDHCGFIDWVCIFLKHNSILKKARKEKKELEKLEELKNGILEKVLNEETLSLIYKDKSLLDKKEIEFFYSLYKMLPKESYEKQIQKRLSISEVNSIRNT